MKRKGKGLSYRACDHQRLRCPGHDFHRGLVVFSMGRHHRGRVCEAVQPGRRSIRSITPIFSAIPRPFAQSLYGFVQGAGPHVVRARQLSTSIEPASPTGPHFRLENAGANLLIEIGLSCFSGSGWSWPA